ncbi:MAG: oligosaccharide flippase family protein [Anaerolineae bacterium]|nr:oligosaccharide flippase family protein [Anaerolineae bacterium]
MFKYLRQLAGESLVYGLSGIISRFLSILLVPLYTRIFSPEDYGVMSLVSTTMAVVAIFVVLALDNSAHRWYWDAEDTADRKSTLASWAWCQIGISVLFAAAIFAVSDRLGLIIVGRSEASVYFRLTALALPLSVLNGVVTNWLRMQRRPWATMTFALGQSLLTILLTAVFVVMLRWGLEGVYRAQLITAFIITIVSGLILRDWISPAYFRWTRLRAMLRYALPLIPAALAYWVVSFADRYFVQYYTNTAEVGLYQVGMSVAALVALATGAFQQAWAPFALSIHKRLDARTVYASTFLAYTWLMSAISVGLALLSPEAIRLIATERYVGASPVVGILAFSYVVIGLGYIAGVGLAIVKVTTPTGIAVVVAAMANVLLNILLVPRMGKVGSAVATLLSQAIVPLYLFYRSQKLYPIPYRFGPAVGVFGLSFILIVLGSQLQFRTLWEGIFVKLVLVALFVPAAFVLRIVTPMQVRSMLRMSRASGHKSVTT